MAVPNSTYSFLGKTAFRITYPGSFSVEANPFDNLIELTVIELGAVFVDRGSDVPQVPFGC